MHKKRTVRIHFNRIANPTETDTVGTMTSAQIDETLFMRFSTTRTRMIQSTTHRKDIVGKIMATDDGTRSSLGHDERKKNYPTKRTFITYYLYLGNLRDEDPKRGPLVTVAPKRTTNVSVTKRPCDHGVKPPCPPCSSTNLTNIATSPCPPCSLTNIANMVTSHCPRCSLSEPIYSTSQYHRLEASFDERSLHFEHPYVNTSDTVQHGSATTCRACSTTNASCYNASTSQSPPTRPVRWKQATTLVILRPISSILWVPHRPIPSRPTREEDIVRNNIDEGISI